MATWRAMSEAEAATVWDAQLEHFPNPSLYQTHGWGLHLTSLGGRVHRLVAESDTGETVAMFQCVEKHRKLGIVALWGAGGPVGDPTHWTAQLRDEIARTTSAKAVYLRFYSHQPADEEAESALARTGWRRTSIQLRSGRSMQLEVDPDPERQRRLLSRNWRHNLKRSGKHANLLSRWERPDPDELHHLYRSMERYKGLEAHFSREELGRFLAAFGDSLVLLRCDDEAGRLLAVRGAVMGRRWAWDALAATSPEGRRTYGAHALMWALLGECRSRSIPRYEMMGVDPERNPGVTAFKGGTGASMVRFLGEWEWASHAILPWGVRLTVRARAA